VGTILLGSWFTWNNVLPALGFLERWPIWTSTQSISESYTDEAGKLRVRSRDVADPITVADLAFAILIGVVTLAAARNVPGLMEIALLQRLPLDNSVRYAISTLAKYLIIMLGLFVAFRVVGLRWSQIQWIATALTFGLAFGLQEMFANFVAGIIILFERPIRVGDIVTVDDVTGTVARIRIRATTITNYDRQDYIVPNRDFITDRVLNWTLSDKVNRVVIPVGVAYGSDKHLVRETLRSVAQNHELVVDEPPAQVTFESFGDSSLQFVLRCYISMRDMPYRLALIDDLHMRIDDAFRAAHIEIAFPQRDLHIRSMPRELGVAADAAAGEC
jgi:potassium efflux system protein